MSTIFSVEISANPTTGPAPLSVQFTPTLYYVPDGVDLPIEKLTGEQYAAIGTKNITASFPYKWYDNEDYPLRGVTVWPIPNTVKAIQLWLWQPLINLEDLDAEIVFPQGYERALRFGLAIELAAEFGKEVPTNVRSIAKMSKSTVKRLNAVPQIMKGSIAIASNKNKLFNYLTGDTIPTNM